MIMQTNNNQPNIWRTIVLVTVGLFVALFLWTFLWNSSNDMKGFVAGIAIGGLAMFPIAVLVNRPRSKPADADAYNTGYERGHTEGWEGGYSYAVQQHPRPQQDSVYEVVVPQHQQRELVPVRR
jgi:hypothetical protein